MSTGAAFAAVLGLSGAPEPAAPSFDGEMTTAPALLWERDLPGPLVQAAKHVELGTPLIDGDEVLLGALAKDSLFVLDRASGTLIHSYPAKGAVQSAPIVDGNHVIFTDSAGYTFCYPRGGTEPIWQHYGGAPILSSPLLLDGVLYVSNVGNTVYALERSTGGLKWRYVHDKDVARAVRLELYGAPQPVSHGELILAGFHDGALVALTKDRGVREWQSTVGEGKYTDIIGRPAVVGEDVIISGFSTPLVSMKLDSRNVRWRVETGGSTDVVVDEDVGFFAANDGSLMAIDLINGATRWSWESPQGAALTTPVLTEAGLYVGTASGGLFLIDEETGEQEWSFVPGVTISGFTAGLAVEGRQLVAVTNQGRVMSFVSVNDGPDFAREANVLPEAAAR